MDIRPSRGGFLRPFGCGWFIREFLMGKGPEESRKIDPVRGAAQADINYEYKEALARATAQDVTEQKAENIYQHEMRRVSRKFTHMRYHSFLMYFGVLKRLGWVETTNETEPSSIQDNYPPAPRRVYYHLTQKGIEAGEELWSNPLFTLYPEIGLSHAKKLEAGSGTVR